VFTVNSLSRLILLEMFALISTSYNYYKDTDLFCKSLDTYAAVIISTNLGFNSYCGIYIFCSIVLEAFR